MNILIIIFGVFLFLAGLLLIFSPGIVFELLNKNSQKLSLYIAAIVVRFIVGALLLSSYEGSIYPTTIKVIGWLFIAAAIILILMGRNNFTRLVTWAFSIARSFALIGGVFALCFGTFLVYAFL